MIPVTGSKDSEVSANTDEKNEDEDDGNILTISISVCYSGNLFTLNLLSGSWLEEMWAWMNQFKDAVCVMMREVSLKVVYAAVPCLFE